MDEPCESAPCGSTTEGSHRQSPILKEPHPDQGITEQTTEEEAPRQVGEKSKEIGRMRKSKCVAKKPRRNVSPPMTPLIESLNVKTDSEIEDEIPLARLRSGLRSAPSTHVEDAPADPNSTAFTDAGIEARPASDDPARSRVPPSSAMESGLADNPTVDPEEVEGVEFAPTTIAEAEATMDTSVVSTSSITTTETCVVPSTTVAAAPTTTAMVATTTDAPTVCHAPPVFTTARVSSTATHATVSSSSTYASSPSSVRNFAVSKILENFLSILRESSIQILDHGGNFADVK
ncbi:mucin-5AC-like [Asparagus officinalis]|uniref:mucin-5AC-like n=1 Tax=Asparagus officinalis TaxID=4686 RepID=UPI00098E5EA7|nr:mucin-5AC-like [Asparagus officinalis]